MWAWGHMESVATGLLNGAGGTDSRWNTGVAVGVTAVAGIALVAIIISSRRGGFKVPWSGRRKVALSREDWERLFTPEGKFEDGGVAFLRKVRTGGVDPSIRAEVWPFLLGVYNLDSSEADRKAIKAKNRKGYAILRKECLRKSAFSNQGSKESDKAVGINHAESDNLDQGCESVALGSEVSVEEPVQSEQGNPNIILEQPMNDAPDTSSVAEKTSSSDPHKEEEEEKTCVTHEEASEKEEVSLDPLSFTVEEPENIPKYSPEEGNPERDSETTKAAAPKRRTTRQAEDFETWQRIIRVDAIRASDEWVSYAPKLASVSKEKAIESAEAVALKDYDHLEPWRIYHAARLVAVLEAYALYDEEIGYCQGMSDLLAPLLAVLEEDDEAFWCFTGFMRKARHSYRLDEVGIRRQLNMVSKIIKFKDPRFYKHLEKLQAEDCFFVYRMVVVMFRRELNFEQTICLWEVIWADQTANRAGFGKSAWGNMRIGAPATDDLLLYAIAASVLQRRKLIIENYVSMDELIRECNSMTGQLDIRKLLDDAHDLVVSLRDRIE